MKSLLFWILLLSVSINAFTQKRYFTKTGTISFEAGTSIEDINAVNKSTTSIFDVATGQLEFAVLIKGFEFKRALMQEHFNENYMESDKYPKSTFKGKITNLDQINFQKEGKYPVTVQGVLELHGVKKEVDAKGQFTVAGDAINGTAAFTIALADYNIEIPGVVKDKISKTVNITVNCSYTPLK
jgi:hypothetical protein